MAFSPVKFLFALLIFSALGWILFVFATRLLTWFLSRVLKASVEFRVAGCTCLRDVCVKFQRGAVESISIGEIKLSLQKSLLKLGFSFISGEPKLQLLICDLDIVLRPSTRPSEKSIKKSKPRKSRSSGRGKWNLVTNISRYISVSITDFVVKAPKAAVDIKDLGVEISKNGGTNPELSVKLCLNPLLVQLCNPSAFEQGDPLLIGQTSLDIIEKNTTTLLIENFMVACEFGHDRQQGIKVKNLDVSSGGIVVNLNEALLLKTKKKPEASVAAVASESTTSEVAAVSKSENNKLSSLLRKPLVPEKVSFNFPKLHAKFVHLGQGHSFENDVMGIHLRCNKYAQYEESRETAAHFDVQMDFSEIHLLRDGNNSILEIFKLAVIGSVDVPTQLVQPVRAEIDVKLGGTQCNLVISRLKPFLRLHFSKKKNMVLSDKIPHKERVQTSRPKTMTWTCTLLAPEATIVLYGNNDSPLYDVCLQSSHLFANNIASRGIQVHAELDELQWHMSDDYRESLKESLFSVEINSDSLLHISHVSLDLGHQEVELNNSKQVCSVDVTDMGVYLSFHHVELVVLTLMSVKALLKSLSGSKNRSSQSSKVGPSKNASSKGTQVLKLNLEKCSITYCGDVRMEDMIVSDPKRVNYGSHGGVSVISISADGTPRTASITPTAFGGCKKLKFSTSLNVSRLNLNANKEKKSLQMDLERAKSIYVEYSDDNKPGANITILDMQSAKFVRRSGGPNEITVCSLVNVTDITVRWEPDFHFAIFEFMTLLKSATNKKKIELSATEMAEDGTNFHDVEAKKETMYEHAQSDKHSKKKKESVFAIDVEKLKVIAELADGVETMVNIQSIFSENARIGLLLEELMLSFNDTRIFKSSRMQISRIPVSITNNVTDTKTQPTTTWDWVIQGPDVHICLPYRLQLRAIDDAVEDTLRGLKLIAAAKTNLLYPTKSSSKKPKSKSSKFGSLRFIVRKLTADIEEEPIQGWLDEHYRMMKSEVCELGVRLKFLDELFSTDQNESGKKYIYNGTEINVSDPEAVKGLRDEIHKQAFQSYYKACKRLVLSEGSGSYESGFQSGFTPSTNRTSLLTITATELDLTLTKIEGGDAGMIEFINKVDPVSLDNEIPFSRMYGRDMSINMRSLAAQIRDYTYPLFSGTCGKCQGRIVLAQQATFFQPQIQQDVFIGRWWKVRMLRSASGTSPPMKTYTELPLHFNKAQLSYGVGYEPVFADISYAFTVALRRAILGTRGNNPMANQPPKKERSLPWWDDMRNYIHGKISLFFNETTWYLLATTNPYEKIDKLKIVTDYMEIIQSDGHVTLSAKEFRGYLSSIENLLKNCCLKLPNKNSNYFLRAPALSIDVSIEWECDSGQPLNHYLYALPKEGKTREKMLDPFRSTSLALRWNISLRPSKDEPLPIHELNKLLSSSIDSPTVNFGAHDLAWLIKWWNMVYLPPQKLRSFSRWPRFGVPRAVRSGNLSLDKVMTEFFLRIDCTPTCIKHMPLGDDDPASGLTFKTAKLKFERCYSRGKQKFTFESKRDPLDLVYQEIDLHQLKANLIRTKESDTTLDKQSSKISQTSIDKLSTERCRDHEFLLETEYFTIRRQSPKADAVKIVAWQEVGRKNNEMMHVMSEKENGSDSDHARSDLSDDEDGIVIADNCQRVFVYGLKLLWTIENRDAVWSFFGGISQAFEPSKISPSRQYAQRKMLEEQANKEGEVSPDDAVNMSSSTLNGANTPSLQNADPLHSPQKKSEGMHNVFVDPGEIPDSEDDGIRHFMVNVIQPQFNLHSEDANGRFLLAAASGRVLARSFHSVLHVGSEMLEKALSDISIPDVEPEMTWKRVELSMMLEQVQAHVAPTDVDPGAGIQWLPKILKSSPKVKRTGALLERVFMPCQMYFRYTRHKGGTPELKVKPLKELKFNSPNITATMTSRQFQVMLDVLTNLLFARLPKPRKSSLKYPTDDNDDVEEEADQVVPDGVEEVELARISVEHREWERKLTIDDVRTLSTATENPNNGTDTQNDGEVWMITGGKSKLINNLEKGLSSINVARKDACLELRATLQKAAQLRLMEKEKNKSPSYAMRISMRIDRVVWSMLADGKPFAEAEINDMIYDFDRDYKDIGIALFTTKSCVLRNCLQNAKCDTVLSAWNPPTDWGKNVMIRVNAKQGAPKDGHSLLETFQVDIYPLKIHLTEAMYRMIWGYLFPEEEQVLQKRQEVWKVSTTAGARRVVKPFSSTDTTASTSHATKESEIPKKIGSNSAASQAASISNHDDSSQVMKLTDSKRNNGSGSTPEFRRTSSFDRTWEETVAESVANELVLQNFTRKKGPLGLEYGEETSKGNRAKDSKPARPGRSTHEEKKAGSKVADDKRTQPRKLMEFHNIRISQVELLVTYEGSRFPVSDLRLLMDSFYREDFTGTWRKLFSRVKKHIIWGVLKSVTGMQGKKFKDKLQSQKEPHGVIIPESDMNASDNQGGQPGKSDQFPLTWNKQTDAAGDGFVTSVRGLFNSQRRKAKAFVLRTMRGEDENEFHGDWSDSEVEFSPFARQLTITKAKKLIRRHTKKFKSRAEKSSGTGMQQQESLPTSPREGSPFPSDSSGESSSYEDINE